MDSDSNHNHRHEHENNGEAHPPQEAETLNLHHPQEIDSQFSHHIPSVARINNGIFGSCPSSVIAAQRLWQMKYLQQPDHFYFNSLKNGVLDSRHVIKDLVNVDDVSEISIVDNATTVAAIVLQQMARSFYEGRFSKGGAIVMLHYAFGAVKKSWEVFVWGESN